MHENDLTKAHFLSRSLLAFIFIPMMQTELDKFKDIIWNSHRIREQKETDLPAGVPNHIYGFPNNYELEDCGTFKHHLQAFNIPNYYLDLSSLTYLSKHI